MTQKRLQELKDATVADEQFQTLADIDSEGWPETLKEVLNCVMIVPTVLNELLFKGQSEINSSSLRRQMLIKLYEVHLGIVKTTQIARHTMFWPNMKYDIEQ